MSTTSPTLTPTGTNFIDEFRCDFDKDMCGMIQDKSADIKFLSHSGSTPSGNTGPSYDHTSGQGKIRKLNYKNVFTTVYAVVSH